MQLQTGQIIGDYRILEVIAEGGFSVVYRAEDIKLKRQVAIKQFDPAAFTEETSRAWFTREAQLTATLEHPNIVHIYALLEEDEQMFLVMEYLPGDLHTLLQESGPLPRADLLRMARDICGALSTLHRHKVIHRDIKPENILIGADGAFKLADLGLAHVRPGQPLGRDDGHGPQPGTLLYMSPEQALGQKVTPRSDLYSLAVVLYEAVTGHYYLPYDEEADDDETLLELIVHADPLPVDTRPPGVPPQIEAVLRRALSKNPAQRPPNAETFLAELKRALTPRRRKQNARRRSSKRGVRLAPALRRELLAIRTLRDVDGDVRAAYERARALWQAHLNVPEVQAEWGETLWVAGDVESGRELLEQALQAKRKLPFAWLALAELYREVDGDAQAADEALVQAIISDPDVVYALWHEEIAAAAQEDPATYEQIVALFRRAIVARPTPAIWHNLGQVLALAPERLAESEAAFEEALALNPRYGPAAVGLGTLLLAHEQAEEAIPLLEEACSAHFPPPPPEGSCKAATVYQPAHAYHALAIAYAQVGDAVRSAEAARHVLALAPHLLEADARALLDTYVEAAQNALAAGHPHHARALLQLCAPLAQWWGDERVAALLAEGQHTSPEPSAGAHPWETTLGKLFKGTARRARHAAT